MNEIGLSSSGLVWAMCLVPHSWHNFAKTKQEKRKMKNDEKKPVAWVSKIMYACHFVPFIIFVIFAVVLRTIRLFFSLGFHFRWWRKTNLKVSNEEQTWIKIHKKKKGKERTKLWRVKASDMKWERRTRSTLTSHN